MLENVVLVVCDFKHLYQQTFDGKDLLQFEVSRDFIIDKLKLSTESLYLEASLERQILSKVTEMVLQLGVGTEWKGAGGPASYLYCD